MIFRSVVVLGILGLTSAIAFYRKDTTTALDGIPKLKHVTSQAAANVREKRATAPYQGPPAPLNRDGTVALTQEIRQWNDFHNAAYAQEYQRLQAAANLAAAHPDRTSPPSPDYNPNENNAQTYNGQHNLQPIIKDQYNSQPSYSTGQYNQQQTGPALFNPGSYSQGASYNQQQYTPPTYSPPPSQSTSYNQQQYSPAPYNQQQYNSAPYNQPSYSQQQSTDNQQQYNDYQSSYNQGTYQNKQSYVPAQLNPDGTAAQTAEYNALAASLQTAYQQAQSSFQQALIGRTRRSAGNYGDASTLQKWNSRAVPYHGPPAPLNHDGTVAYTPALLKAKAAHSAAFAHEFKRLQETENFAAAHPDYTSPPHHDTKDNGEYHHQEYAHHQFDDGQYHHQQHYNGQHKQEEDDGQYKPYLYEKENHSHNDNGRYHQQEDTNGKYYQQEDDGQYKPYLYEKEHYQQ